ncbi:MAG: LutB/LldF family L-lactate oxidation iron-sulfur protein [Acidobacteria bacterium]|nr:LutB/LldF family L-lactate oxidation iron-sulfur protein [Acidobacteriota bacterium]
MSDLPIYTESIHTNARNALRNTGLRSALSKMAGHYGESLRTIQADSMWETYRERAREIKREAINHLDLYLERFTAKVEENGGQVHWARDADEANRIVVEIARRAGIREVVKAKTMLGEEIELNQALERNGIRPIETDLGEFIIQLAGERPSHIVGPAMHKTRGDVARLFAEKLEPPGAPVSDDPAQLTKIARRRLRERFARAQMGISGANFAVAETGTIVLVENEGNIRLSTTIPRIHVALIGIEKMIPRFRDLAVMMRVLPRAGTGQKLTAYISLLNGPAKQNEDGPEEVHVVLVDNGRVGMLADPKMREVLNCIRCGACLNVCPVFHKIGGHAYGWVYSGPIGALVTPQLLGLERARELPFASSLCGACRDVCPVKINIPDLLLHLRAQVQQTCPAPSPADSPVPERWVMRLWAWTMTSPRRYVFLSRLARWGQSLFAHGGWIRGLPLFPLSAWTASRDFPALAPESFRERWAYLTEEKSGGRKIGKR